MLRGFSVWWIMKKNFYHKIGVAELLAEVLKRPDDAERGKWLLLLALDLECDEAKHCKTELGKSLITRTKKGRKKATESGKIGAEKRWKKEPENKDLNSDPIKKDSNPIASSRSSSRSSNSISKPKPVIESLPECIDPLAWAGFVDMRKHIKAPMTDHAKRLAILKLEKLNACGQNPNDILDQSTINSWKGLFEVKEKLGNDSKPAESKKMSVMRRLQENANVDPRQDNQTPDAVNVNAPRLLPN